MGGTWTCDWCGYGNMALNRHCGRCDRKRTQGESFGSQLDVRTVYGRNVPDIAELSLRNRTATFPYRKFEDQYFPANDVSLGEHNRKSRLIPYGRPTWHVEKWLPPELIKWSTANRQIPLTVFNSPNPGDIVQGKLGDCWLIAALSLVAEVPSILFKIMVTKVYNPNGFYQVRLCDRGIWKVITIDDRFPMSKHDFFIFTYARRRQLFASLIEKAFAKLHGNYNALKSGRCDEGLQALTGEPTEVLFLRSASGKINEQCDSIWARMLLAHRRGYLMTCPASNPKLSNSIFDRRGIESNHAYSIMNVFVDGYGSRLVTLRNPWGSRALTSTSKSNLNNSSGLITIAFEEMAYYFSSVSICKFNPRWTEVRKRGQFASFSSPLIESVYSLEVHYPMQLEIELFNAGDGWYYNRRHDPDIDLCLIVLRNGQAIGYNHDVDFYVSFSSDRVTPGIYQIIAISFSTLHHKVFPIYNIVFHGSKHFVVHNSAIENTTLASVFHKIAISQKNVHPLSSEASIMTFNDNGNFGMVVENRYPQPIRVHSDFHGTKNVLSSRGSNLCVDVVPAYSRVLITIFTRRVYKGNVLISYRSKAQKVTIQEAHQPALTPENSALHHAVRL